MLVVAMWKGVTDLQLVVLNMANNLLMETAGMLNNLMAKATLKSLIMMTTS